MDFDVCIIGAGLAGSEAALQLAERGVRVFVAEARPYLMGPVHKTGLCAELVCSNSLKSLREDSAAGMLKHELDALGSHLYCTALDHRVAAGGALAVDRTAFSQAVTDQLESSELIGLVRKEACSVDGEGTVTFADGTHAGPFSAIVVATGPLTSDSLASWLSGLTGTESLSFYDAAAPIVLSETLDREKLFSQSRYEEGEGDYLNAPLSCEEYDAFIDALVHAKRALSKDFEHSELFQACQPIEEVARAGHDAPRFGTMKPVGLVDPATGKRPWAALQLRAEDTHCQSYNLVGCQTNLTFPEQKRVFRMIPGLEHAEFARYGVMHRNTFLDAPRVMDRTQRIAEFPTPLFLAGQVSGTEGYCEAIRSGLQAALEVFACVKGIPTPQLPKHTAYGALLAYATCTDTKDYQPMHVNFGIMEPLDPPVRNKGLRKQAYAERGREALDSYLGALSERGLLP